ncbi:hypothetical protein [Paenibacillus xylanexedens]|uniref:hypothetical protein n=1 Tax=Paenibacillus xylanexedens TaxID=528191 RepID=UPI001C8EE128|nr:hypothetical protein [Paenibacillus xylanexedens]
MGSPFIFHQRVWRHGTKFAVPGTMLEKEKEHDQVINNLNQNIEQTHSQINGKPKVMVVKVLSKTSIF